MHSCVLYRDWPGLDRTGQGLQTGPDLQSVSSLISTLTCTLIENQALVPACPVHTYACTSASCKGRQSLCAGKHMHVRMRALVCRRRLYGAASK